METSHKTEIYIPKLANLSAVKYMAVSAHHDDIEIMAGDGIIHGQSTDGSFYAVVVSDGAGSSRSGDFSAYSDEQMKKVRNLEQKEAAEIGHYNGVAFLNFKSSEIKNSDNVEVTNELKRLIKSVRPDVIYTHNIFDKHETHIAVARRVIEAINEMEMEIRPQRLYGCEVWRGLDWINDEKKICFNLSGHEQMLKKLLSVYKSQIDGGKRYDLATIGRWRSNATYSESHKVDDYSAISFGIDMTKLIDGSGVTVKNYVKSILDEFCENVIKNV
ncbi:MAG: PIG-L family deacetylase [Clostridia bacterium]